jgi:hypothetical protein
MHCPLSLSSCTRTLAPPHARIFLTRLLFLTASSHVDNGGYYHYSTGTDKSKTYEEVLPKVKAINRLYYE